MVEKSDGWHDAARKTPTPGKLVLALWMPPHHAPEDRVCYIARWDTHNWEIFDLYGKRTVPRVDWWQDMPSLPAGIKIANT